jgi:hypothetical protein
MIELEKIRRRHAKCYGGKLIAQAHCDMGELLRFIEHLQKRESELLAACANLNEKLRFAQSAIDDLKGV